MRNAIVVGLAVAATMGLAGAVFAEGEPSISLLAPKFEAPIKVDGVMDDAGWVTASARGGKTVLDISHDASVLSAYPRACYVGYDDKNLNFGFVIMSDKELVGTDGAVWGEDQCEMFFSLDGEGYGHVGVNVAGTVNTEVKGDMDWDLSSVKAAVGKAGIARYMEVAVPFAAMGLKTPKSGSTIKINLNGHQTEGDLWIAANATYGGFHNPERFFTLTFE